MSKTLYLECTSGISGDMTVAALLDLGASEEKLRQVLATMPVQGFAVEISRVKKAGVDCCDFNVKLDVENHDHDMEYLHGHEHHHHHHDEEEHEHRHHHHDEEEHEHHHHHHNLAEHSHEHPHAHDHGGHDHVHRHLGDILAILHATQMSENARALAVKIFTIVAEAEAKAHAMPLEEVHFHEVGAVDSIVDIVSAAVCLDDLGVEQVIVPKLCEGSGTVRCQHGILPVPVPAVSNIAAAYGLPLEITSVQGELVTPTGAAIVAAIKTGEALPSPLRVEKIGIGAGKRQYERPSMLRAMLIAPANNGDCIYKLECNMDDCTGEALGYVMERLLQAGARDVHYIPVYMKKNRPACQLNVICDEAKIPVLEGIIFRETTTIGIRRQRMERTVLQREMRTVQTPYGAAEVKVCTVDGQQRAYPEYESVAALCRATGASYQEVCAAVLAAAR